MFLYLLFVHLFECIHVLWFQGIPNATSRQSILSTLLKKIPNTLTTKEIDALASKSHGYVGADLAATCREAGLKAIKRCIKESKRDCVKVNIQDMEAAMAEIRPSAMREVSTFVILCDIL